MFIWGYYQKDGIEARNVMLIVGVPGFTIACSFARPPTAAAQIDH
jgi:hypothetical protein